MNENYKYMIVYRDINGKRNTVEFTSHYEAPCNGFLTGFFA